MRSVRPERPKLLVNGFIGRLKDMGRILGRGRRPTRLPGKLRLTRGGLFEIPCATVSISLTLQDSSNQPLARLSRWGVETANLVWCPWICDTAPRGCFFRQQRSAYCNLCCIL